MERRWYLDTGASKHMAGKRDAFIELDDGVVGTMNFGDGSTLYIRGPNTMLFN
jgi:hypothetical protein